MESDHLVSASEATRAEVAMPGAANDNEPPPPATSSGKPQKKIAILGTTPSRMQGPIDDPSWEIWTIGPGGKDAHRWDRLFECHGIWPADFVGYLNDLSKVKLPQQVVTIPQPAGGAPTWGAAIERWKRQHKLPDEAIEGNWEAVVEYPREAMFEKYGRRMWFSSSIAYCIPLAIEEGATDIGLWGIDLESGEEYISQFVGCAHFIDLARLAGVNVHLPKDCGLLRDPNPYPDRYETFLAQFVEKKLHWLQHQLGQAEPHYESLKAEVHRFEGKCLQAREMGATPEKVQELEGGLLQHNIHLGNLASQVNQLRGELGAVEFMKRMFMMGIVDPEVMGLLKG